ncbi:MAG: hypothetical protein HZR80_02380 [Candidatus Heimdallarchaeota archaeon]
MKDNKTPESQKNDLRRIMRNHGLAKFGDALTNFLYSRAKTNVVGKPVGERVFDKALAESLRQIGLRKLMPSNSSSGDLGDGVEALIGYGYLHGLITIDELTEIVESTLKRSDFADLSDRKVEREAMIEAFKKAMLEIMERMKE